jgi:hypothetical protein
LLENTNYNKDDGSGNVAEGGMAINYFDFIYDSLTKEIDILMKCAKQVMHLPQNKAVRQ